MPPENRIIYSVGDDLNGAGPVHFEPLGALPPLFGLDVWAHAMAVTPKTSGAWIIVGADEGLGRIGEVGVDGCEVEEGNA